MKLGGFVLAHALHAEELQTVKKEKVKAKTDKDLELALVHAVSKPGGFSVQRNQQKVGEEEKRQGGRNFEKTEAAGSAPLMIMSSSRCTKCRLCKMVVIGPRTVRRTSEIKKQTEARTVESSRDGKRGSSLREPLKREVKMF